MGNLWKFIICFGKNYNEKESSAKTKEGAMKVWYLDALWVDDVLEKEDHCIMLHPMVKDARML